jgi:hypothetical protein
MSRIRWVAVAVVAVAAAIIAALFFFRDTATPVDAAAVGDLFSGTVGIDSGDPGVYRYSTVGFESVDALGGASHEYPATTYMTITDGPCGPIVRWQALQERWVEWSHCGPDLAVTESVEYHEWFGIPDTENEQCLSPRPIFASAEEIACVEADSTETYRVELIANESIEVGGESIETVHIRRSSALSGGSTGETVADLWRLVDTPLVVRLQLTSQSATSSAIGDVVYHEEVTLELLDLLPQG